MHDVTVIDPGFCTPRIVMHRWLKDEIGVDIAVSGLTLPP